MYGLEPLNRKAYNTFNKIAYHVSYIYYTWKPFESLKYHKMQM